MNVNKNLRQILPDHANKRVHPDYDQEILAVIRGSDSPKVLRDQLSRFHSSSIADAMFDLNAPEREKLYKLLDTARLADVLEYLDEKEQVECLSEIHIRKVISLLNEMDPSAAADLLRLMPKTRRDIIIELLEPEKRKELNLIISYSKDLIGSEMTTDFIEINKDLSIADAMRQLREQAKENDNISMIYLHDNNDQYYGAIRIADLFSARLNDNLEELAEINFPFVYATEKTEDVLENLREYSEDSIPVLNNENRLLGIITYQDLLEVFDRESGEDYIRFAAVSAEEDLDESLFRSVKKRLPWLILLLALALGVSTVVSMFESVVASLTVLMVFQSLILDMAGNVGTQSLAVTIRVLADPGLDWSDRMKLILKEVRTGFVNGLILGISSGLVLGLFIHFSNGYDFLHAYAIAGCNSLSMLVSMVISSFTGTAIPILFKAVHIDPAAASGPLITTLNDLIGVVCYYSLSWLILIQVLHI